MTVTGKDVIAVPMLYYDEFRRDPQDSLLKYGSLAQRARAPYFTNPVAIDNAMKLSNVLTGPRVEEMRDRDLTWPALIGAPDEYALIEGLSPQFSSSDHGFWHVHADLALHKRRHGDAAGIAMGRITNSYIERSSDPSMAGYERIVRVFELPLVAQIVAPTGDQVYLSSVTRFILQLRQLRGFNITSFSFDGWQSADAAQQLTLAGLVTHGMQIDPISGVITGLPKPFSVDGSNTQPYREALEAFNEGRALLPRYPLLRRELRTLETTEPGHAPDHAPGMSKDVADCVAGVIGYLSAYGHALLEMPGRVELDRDDLAGAYDLGQVQRFGIEDDEVNFGIESGDLSFGVE